MKKAALIGVLVPSLLLAGIVAAGCSSKDETDNVAGPDAHETKPLLDPARADELAHAMMLQPADLPGSGWEVVGTDQFDDDSDDESFEKLAASVPACSGLTDLARLGEVMGDDEGDLPAGRAQVELDELASGAFTIPSNVEFEVEIEETVVEAQGGWGIAKQLFESKETKECFPALMEAAMLEEMPDEDGFKVTLDSASPSADAPGDGIEFAFAMHLDAGFLGFDVTIEMYMWPYSNAGVTLMVMHDADTLTADDVKAIVAAADAKVKAAAK